MGRIDFDITNFNSCKFKKVDFAAGYFITCNIIECNFEQINVSALCPIIVDSKISKSDNSIKLKGGFNFDALLEFLNSLPD